MPDCHPLSDSHLAAVKAIDDMARSQLRAAALTQEQLAAYRAHTFTTGWRVPAAYKDIERSLDLLLPASVPYDFPRVALVDPPPALTWPHVEMDGMLCLTNSGATIDVRDPAGVALAVLRDANRLVRQCIVGENKNDFLDEFQSYWHRAGGRRGKEFLSLIRVGPPSRWIHAWRGEKFVVLADTRTDLLGWLDNRYTKPTEPRTLSPALFVWLTEPMSPGQYPGVSADVKLLLERLNPEALSLLKQLAQSVPERVTLLFGATSKSGNCLAGLTMQAPADIKFGGPSRQPYVAGFRPGHTPPDQLSYSYLAAATGVARSDVSRVDPAWVHGRGHDPRQPALATSSVVVVGCGSVGGHLTFLLAEAGVGKLTAVDPQNLEWANIGRHRLGARWIGLPKAASLLAELQVSYPHSRFEAQNMYWEEAAVKNPAIFRDASLVVNVTGSWMSNAAMSNWQRESAGPPILYGWTEAYACAGHAVAIAAAGACLECGFDRLGHPLTPVTVWKNGPTERREPACGVVFQPYGPVELMNTVQLIAGAALDLLTGRRTAGTHWVYASPRDFLTACGGDWNGAVTATPGWRPEGGCSFTRTWDLRPDCVGHH